MQIQGVPVRIAIGQKDMQKQTMEVARRDTGAKEFMPWDQLLERIPQLLDRVQVCDSVSSGERSS